MNTYKTSTFLTGLFCKFRLQDKDIRKTITELYGTLIDSILQEASEEKRILLFKSLIPVIKSTIDYFLTLKKNNLQVDNALYAIVIQLVAHCTYTIQKIGISNTGTSKVFKNIVDQAFIIEIGCDIGDCIRLYKEANQTLVKSDIVDRLTILLADYNAVMHTDLTLTDVLVSKKGE